VYYRICVGLVDDLATSEKLKRLGQNASAAGGVSTRTAVMGLFGMMNWLYTWYKPRVDPGADVIARQISDIFLQGVRGDKDSAWRPTQLDDANAAQPAEVQPKKRARKRS
jgi:hypothetical protein